MHAMSRSLSRLFLSIILAFSLVGQAEDKASVEDSIDKLRQALVDVEASLRSRTDRGDGRLETKLSQVESSILDLRNSLGKVDSALNTRIRRLENQMDEVKKTLDRKGSSPSQKSITDLTQEIARLRQDLDRLAKPKAAAQEKPAPAPPICSRFETVEAYNAIKACGTDKDTWYCVGKFMKGNPTAQCPGVASYCFARCVTFKADHADVCASNCELWSASKTRCEDWELEVAGQAIDSCARHGDQAWYCLQYFMLSMNKVSRCRGMAGRCFSACAKASPGRNGCDLGCKGLR